MPERPRFGWLAAWATVAAVPLSVLAVLGAQPQKPYALSISDTLRLSDSPGVQKIIDGDTFILSDGRHIRLLSIDTPEEGEPFYSEAKAFADSILYGKAVRLEIDRVSEDKYGRVLAYAYVDSLFYNELIIRVGLAHVYLFKKNERYSRRLISAQNDARNAKRGIWSLPAPEKEDYYLAAANSFRFHRPLCPAIKNINLKKARRFKNRDSALDQGLSPCRNCRP
jgi:micrococcal nuclease